jgi:SAM-dependent methyltransferase
MEFTGERVVPGLVDPDLFNEHLSRYRFAARFAAGGKKVLDAGCGTGYGTAEFEGASQVMAIDISGEAVAHAAQAFGRPGVHFLQSACEALPFADESFDLVVAFEVIEHLERWQDLLAEARRVLRSEGVLLVSTPNKAYYAEARAAAGPNPYHVREFEYREFECALKAVFPHVRLWSQNHSQVIAFVPSSRSGGVLDAPADSSPDLAHFFLAACSRSPVADTGAFGWLPSSGNILRDRERHIALLNSELRQKEQWLGESQAARDELQRTHDEVVAELRRSNEWADGLNRELKTAGGRIAELQTELEQSNAWADGVNRELKIAGGRIAEVQKELEQSNAWAESLNVELKAAGAAIEELNRELTLRLDWVHETETRLGRELAVRLEWVHDVEAQLDRARNEIARLNKENIERTQWAQSLDAELQKVKSDRERFEAQLRMIGDSKWVRLGRTAGVGPVIDLPGGLPADQ